MSCSDGPFTKTAFSIGHRGAALQFPEHTREAYEAGARMGAGIVECDVTFTKDKELVCRHSQADLHTTTNILVTPLASKCTRPFTPAVFGPTGDLMTPADAEAYAQKMIDEYKAARVSPKQVWPQSFDQRDILYWISHEPAFGKQAVYLDDANVPSELPGFAELVGYKQMGISIVGPPTFALLDLDATSNIVPSQYARNVKAAGLEIITWTLERSGILADGNNGFYYQTVDSAIRREGDVMKVLDVLARDVGIIGIFSDWAATVTYYADCMGLK